MTRTYTAADFANARFAEHELGLLAIRSDPDDIEKPWADGGGNWYSDQAMARDGWVPVPTKPTITESELDELHIAAHEIDGRVAIREAARSLDIEVIPDPEPTNTDKLTRLINSAQLTGMDARNIAEYLDGYGIRVKGN